MEIAYTQKALIDLELWRKSGNKNIQKKISEIIESIQQNPFEGIGKPEALKYELAGKWSRRISTEHRIIYQVQEDKYSFNPCMATTQNKLGICQHLISKRHRFFMEGKMKMLPE